MKVTIARALALSLTTAADAADAAGQTDIDITAALAIADDAARATLQAAIDAAGG